MRNKILVFILLFLGPHANAKPVTQETAQQVAQAFLSKEQATPPQIATKINGQFIVSNQATGLTLGKIQAITDEHGETLAYVQELEPQGFIIASADDNIRPVIGFSYHGRFPFRAGQGNPLLDLIKSDLHARKELASVSNKEAVGLESSTQWGPWLQTDWSQSGHWNSECPYIYAYGNPVQSRRPAGCVAIATAQIVNYWKYPMSISFSSTDDHYTSGNIDVFGDASKYGFPTASELTTALQNILYNGDANEEAYLCLGIGVKTQMEYGAMESGAYSRMAACALRRELDYGSGTYKGGNLVWNNYRDDVIQNMKDGWPVYLGISKHWLPLMGGHAVVSDGYRDSDEYFHINLGWELPSLWNIWYDLPNIAGYSLIDEIIFDIAKYQGWNQYGADEKNTFGSVYGAPEAITEKWRATCSPDTYFSSILIGTSNHIYAAASPNASSGHSFIYIIDQFGTTLRRIEINQNGKIDFMCQSRDGELFVAVEDGGIYRVDPKQGTAVQIFVEPYGGQINVIKIDEEGWLFAVTFDRVYALTRTGSNRWSSPFIVPSGATFLGPQSIPAIDVSRQRVYIMYRSNYPTYYGYLVALNRLDGQAAQPARDFGRTVPSLRVPSLGADGTIYIGGAGTLYALNPDDFLGTPRWTKSLLISGTPAVGRNGTLYFPYWEQSGTTWYNKLGAFNPSNGSERWNIPFLLDPNEEDIFQPYIARNGIVLFTIEHNGTPKTYTVHAYKDNGSSAQELWHYNAGTSGGDFAFGPGRTVYAWGKTGLARTIYALSEGDIGDPYGAGMNFENNNMPISPSNPGPANGAKSLDTASIQLSWTCSDPDGQALKYDIYACALVDTEEATLVPVANQVTGNSFTLTHLQNGTEYLWAVVATDGQAISEGPVWSFSTGTTDVDDEGTTILPKQFALGQNYPNPFNPVCNIEYSLPRSSHVWLSIYNILGQKVRVLVDEYQSAGYKSVRWDGKDYLSREVPSGIYFYRIEAGDFAQAKKMVLIK